MGEVNCPICDGIGRDVWTTPNGWHSNQPCICVDDQERQQWSPEQLRDLIDEAKRERESWPKALRDAHRAASKAAADEAERILREKQ